MPKVSLNSIFLLLVFFASCSKDSGLDYSWDRLNELKNVVPVVVIGSGPSGYAAALYSARGGNYTLVIEGDSPGGQLMQTSFIENWPGIPKISGQEVMKNCKEQCAEWGVKFLADSVAKVDFSSWPFKIYTVDKKEIIALSVVVATGASSKKLDVPGESKYWGIGGVSSCAVCDAPMYKGKDVIVVGGGDSAIEQVFQLSPYVKSIKLFVRKDKMRASQAMQEKLKSYPKATVMYNHQINSIHGNEKMLEEVEILNNKTGKITKEKIDGIFLAVGHEPNTKLFDGQLQMEDGYIKTFGRGAGSSVKGVFVAGESEDHTFMQAGTAAGDGIKAGMGANFFLRDINFSPEKASSLESKFYVPSAKLPEGIVHEIKTEKEFEEKVENSQGIVIVDFFSTYCQPCKVMLPRFKEVAAQLEDRTFYKVNVDDIPDLVSKYYIIAVPCFMVFKDGKMVIKYQKMMTKDQLLNLAKDFVLP